MESLIVVRARNVEISFIFYRLALSFIYKTKVCPSIRLKIKTALNTAYVIERALLFTSQEVI